MSGEQLRTLAKDCLDKGLLSAARFYADKLVIVSKNNFDDIYLLARIHFVNKEYRLCVHILQQSGLVPQPNAMGISDITYQSELKRITSSHNRTYINQNSPLIPNKSESNPQSQKPAFSRQQQLQHLLLATTALYECGDYESSLLLLGDADDLAFQHIQPDLIDNNPTNANQSITVSSALCVVRARILEKSAYLERTVFWLKKALLLDAKNSEAFELLVSRRMITPNEARQLISSLVFSEDQKWVQFYYEAKIEEIAPTFADVAAMKRSLTEKKLYPLTESTDLQIVLANSYHSLNCHREAYAITREVICRNPYCLSILESHIGCLVELGKQAELYKHAHDLVEDYPEHALSWFAVGAYYYMIRRHDTARRFLHKATRLDKFFAPAWLLFGHTFTEQDAHDQAMAAYRSAHKWFPGSHLPLLFMGIQYVNMQNYLYADKFLHKAAELFDQDPMIFSELGVVAFHQKNWEMAQKYFLKAISMLSEDCYETWESTFLNLGHSYRKCGDYDEALRTYLKAFNISPRDTTVLSSIGFVYHLKGDPHTAAQYYHKVLGLSPHDTFAHDMLSRAMEEIVSDNTAADAYSHTHMHPNANNSSDLMQIQL